MRIIILISIFFSSILIPVLSIEAAVLSKPTTYLGLVGYWSFNEGMGTRIGDFSGYDNDITSFTNMDTNAMWVDGKFGKGIEFDGINDLMTIPNAPEIDLDDEDYSISAWIKTTNTADQNIINKHVCGTNQGQFLNVSNGTQNKAVFGTGVSGQNMASNTSVNNGVWHHIVATFRASDNQQIIYVDGLIDMTPSGGSNPSGSDVAWQIGGGSNGCTPTTVPFDGIIDEVKLFNRVLTANEVDATYQSGLSKIISVPKNNLVGYWSFNDGRGTVVTDFSGNGNNGTLTNMDAATDWVSGKFGYALDFDGTDDVVRVGAPSVLEDLPESDFSISLWANLRSDGENGRGRFLDKANDPGGGISNGWEIQITATGEAAVEFYILFSGTHMSYITVNNTLTYNQWDHVVFVYDVSSKTAKIYVNGAEASYSGLTAGSGTYQSDSGLNLNIGDHQSGTRALDGMLDEIRIYNKELSVDEISSIYNSSKHVRANSSQANVLQSGLIGMWDFNGPNISGSTVTDVSENNNHGTITGAIKTIGKIGQALAFDGSGDYVAIGATGLGTLNTGSVSLWFNLISSDDSSNGALYAYSRGADATISEFRVYVDQSNYTTQSIVAFLFTGGTTQWQINVPSSAFNSRSDFGWHHLVITQNASTPSLYVDGVSVGSLIVNGNQGYWFNDTTADSSTINGYVRNIGPIANPIPSKIDEVRIYNRALSVSEITHLYNIGR